MIIGIGCDLCSLPSMKDDIDAQGELFLKQFCKPSELSFIAKNKNPIQTAAAIFAMKEAFAKAIGRGFWGDLWFDNLEIANMRGGHASLRIEKTALKTLHDVEGIRFKRTLLSYSCAAEYAMGTCIVTDT